jgi:hypothetical protein
VAGKKQNGSSNAWFGNIRGTGQELRDRLAQDAAERAAEGKREGSIILNQKDVLTGSWDAHKVLFTTLGGKLRAITADDLAAFRRNIQTAQSRLKKGITAKQIIDWSSAKIDGGTKSDLERARTEIRFAVPVRANNGRVFFTTNSGPDSKVSRHHVIVEFLNYGAEAASGVTDPRKSAMRLRKGPVKIECDCERWRYFGFRYMATIGGYNAGRAETGYSKIKNPRLQSLACKHIVRVMSEVDSGGAALAYLTNLMSKAKSNDEAKAKAGQSQREAERILRNQERRTTGNEIKTSEQKRLERQAAKAKKEMTDKMKGIQTKKPKPASKKTTRINDLVALYRKNGVSRQAVESFLDMGAIALPKGTTRAEFLAAYDSAG